MPIAQAAAVAVICTSVVSVQAADWSVAGTILTPSGIITDSALSISNGVITAIGPITSLRNPSSAVRVQGIILPGFIDLHNHLTWNVLPRWVLSHKFNNRYEWQDTAEYDRVLVEPHNAVLNAAACESEIYAEIKALAGGATSVVGSLLPSKDHPDNAKCAAGLARNLDVASGLSFAGIGIDDPCEKKAVTPQPLLDVVDNEVFPLELTHPRFDFLLCELGTGTLRSLIIHLSEGATPTRAHTVNSLCSIERACCNQGSSSFTAPRYATKTLPTWQEAASASFGRRAATTNSTARRQILPPPGQPRFPSPSLLTGALPGAPG